MNDNIKAKVIDLLENTPTRIRNIELLRYELKHHPRVSTEEMIEALTFHNADGEGHAPGARSDIEELNTLNRNNDNVLTVNSFYIIDDAKQRDKMTEEFYSAVKKEIAEYQERADYLIRSGSNSPSIMERWVIKIKNLEEKKRHYEAVLQRELDGLDDEFENLKFLSQELSIRANGARLRKAA